MKRRTLLAAAATSAAGLAGCLAGSSGDDDGNDSDGSNDSGGNVSTDGGTDESGGRGGNSSEGGDDSDDDNPPHEGDDLPTIVEDGEIETTGTDCGSEESGDATAERGDGEVTVDGVIGASDPCHDAVLRDVAIHNRQLVLTVDVEERDGMCSQCLGAIDYTATVTVTNVDELHGATADHVGGDEHATNWDEPGEPTP